jgi:hypothetical protein
MPLDSDPSLVNCTTLSVTDFVQNNLTVYPNPTQDKLTISAKNGLGEATFKLMDLNGRTVLTIKQQLLDTVTINMANLQDGIYVLSITGDNFNFIDKVVKN